MLRKNRWYKLNEKEFTDTLRFVKLQFPKLVNDEKYIKSLDRVADAFTNNKVLYLQLKYHFIDGSYITWHYRTSYSTLYCGECLEYKDIKLTPPPANCEVKIIDDMIANDDKQSLEQWCKAAKKLMMNSVYGKSFDKDAFDDMFYANFDTNTTKKIIENKEEKVMEENKIQGITNIINKYRDDAERELNRLYKEQRKEIKAKDPNVIALKQYVEVLNKNRAKNTKPYDANTFNEIYTAETEVQLFKVYDELTSKKQALLDLCNEVYNLCMLCDTYEQMRQVLGDYKIIPNTKKRGK